MRILRTWLLPALCLLALPALAQTGFFFGTDIYPSLRQLPLPGVNWGGVVHCIARNPENPAEVFVGTAAGGLFKSTDAGNNWAHVDGFRPTRVMSLAFVDGGLLATTGDDWLRETIDPSTGMLETWTGAGVWKSRDGGGTWSQTLRVTPCTWTGVQRRPMAFGLAVHPRNRRTAYVATMCGIYASIDSGDSFRQSTDTAGTIYEAIIALPTDRVVIGGPGWINYRFPGAGSFLAATSEAGPGPTPPPNLTMESYYGPFRGAFATSPVADNDVYGIVSAPPEIDPGTEEERPAFNLIVSTNGGASWRAAKRFVARGGCGGALFVRTARNRDRDADVDVFVGDTCGFSRATIADGDSALLFSSTLPWQSLGYSELAHPDIHDLEVVPGSSRQILLAGDGGLSTCSDRAGRIECPREGMIGAGRGLNALEIPSVSGQRLSFAVGPPRAHPTGLRTENHLYFSTWHNSLWASSNLGESWRPEPWSGEGFGFELARRVPPGGKSVIAYVGCFGCENRVSGPLFSSANKLLNPGEDSRRKTSVGQFTFVPSTPPVFAQILNIPTDAPRVYVAGSVTPGSPPSAAFTEVGYLQDCGDGSGLCTRLASLSALRFGGFLGEGRTNPALYTAVKGSGRPALALVSDFLDSSGRPTTSADVRFPRMDLGPPEDGRKVVIGFGLPSTVEREVFGIDSANPAHLIAPDVGSDSIVESWDFGDSWTTIKGAAEQVTGVGEFRFKLDVGFPGVPKYDVWPLVTTISFCPDNPELVLLGTTDNGVFLSKDRGQNWRKIPGSDVLPSVSEFHWRSANKVLAASGGRGVWEITLDVVARPPSLGLICPECRFSPALPGVFGAGDDAREAGDPITFADAQLLVMDGRVESVKATPNARPSISVTPGSSWVWFADPQVPLPAEVVEGEPSSGFAGVPVAAQLQQQGEVISGFSFLKGALTQVIHGGAEAQLPQVPAAQLPPLPKQTSLGLQGKPYVTVASSTSAGSRVRRGSSVIVGGQNFSPQGGPVTIEVDGTVVLKSVQLDPRGSFSVSFPAAFPEGPHRMVVSQQMGQQQAIQLVDGFMVEHADPGDEGKK